MESFQDVENEGMGLLLSYFSLSLSLSLSEILFEERYRTAELTLILNHFYLDPSYWNSVKNYRLVNYILLHLHFVIPLPVGLDSVLLLYEKKKNQVYKKLDVQSMIYVNYWAFGLFTCCWNIYFKNEFS